MQSHSTVSESVSSILNQYKDKVLNPTYFPSTPEETLQARFTATYLLSSLSSDEVSKARDLINKTSMSSNDLDRLLNFSASVIYWEALNVNETDQQQFCEYSLIFHTKNGRQVMHYHANYQLEEKQCRFVSQKSSDSLSLAPQQTNRFLN